MPKRSAPQNSQHRRVSKRLRIKNALFPRFKELPTEIRLQIWLTAVHQATVDRSIHVEVHPLLHVTDHSCLSNGVFCGQHGSCSTLLNVDYKPSICMIDGYFSSTRMLSSLENAISSPALASLSLACRESRTAVLELYPKVLKIFQHRLHRLHPGVNSRLVRCHPETDVLVIHAVPETSLRNMRHHSTEASWRLMNEAKMRKFPNNERQFSAFKDMISSFQNVAICASDHDEVHDERNQEQTHDVVWPDNDSISLLLFFKSLKHLSFWVDPLSWPCAGWKDGARSNNVEDIDFTMQGADTLRREILEFLNDYNAAVQAQDAHSVADDEHWVPQPKLLEHIGYCFPESWFMMMRLKAFGLHSMPSDAATTDELKSFWSELAKPKFF